MSKSKEDGILQFIFNNSILGTEFINSLDHVDSRIFYYLMEEYSKSQSIAFVKWKDDRGYLPFQKPDSSVPEWGWKRQENQIIWSKWINNDQLYDLFIQHQSTQP